MPGTLRDPPVLVLGPIAVGAPDRATAVQGALVRRLLAALALAGRDGRTADGLVDDVWEDDPPRAPRGALQMLVSRARALLPDGAIESTASGYRLTDSDLARAEADAVAGADGPALETWRGAPGDDLDGQLGAALAGRAQAAQAALLRARVGAQSAAGRADDAARTAARLVALRPFDGPAAATLIEALRDAGRPAEALAAFADYRDRLADGLGADPDPALVALNAELLRSDGAETVGLRAATDALLGRDDDLAAVVAAVRSGRLTTVVGPGGLGKTRLAHAAGLALTDAFERIVFVELAGASTADDVPLVLGSAIGARVVRADRRLGEPPPPELAQRTREVLASRRTLVILDNCEQVVEPVARLVADLLAAVPTLSVLTTSRVPLLVRGERTVAPAPLDPATDGSRLFRLRAHAARPGALLDPDAVVRICARLDGLPLAIELAAARIRAMSLPELEERLADRFGVLVGGDRTAPERHRTLLAVIDWSWQLLEPAARAALAALAVFPDGFTGASASMLLERDATGLVEDLVDQSLLVLREQPRAAPRFRMLETVREFGLRALAAEGAVAEADAALDRWAARLAADRLDGMTGGRNVADVWLVGAEEETLLALLRDRVHSAPDTALTAFALLGEWWVLRGDFGTLVAHAATVVPALPAARVATPPVATRAVFLAAVVLVVSGSPHALRALAMLRVVAARTDIGDGFWATWTRLLARVPSIDDLPAVAREAASSADDLVAAFGELVLGQLIENTGRIEEARRAAGRAIAAAERAGAVWFGVLAAATAVALRAQLADWATALAEGQDVQRRMLALDPRADTRQLDWALGLCEIGVGRLDAAESRLTALLGGPARPNDLEVDDIRAVSLAGLAEVAEARGDVALADLRWARARGRRPESPWAVLTVAAAVAARARRGAATRDEIDRLRVMLVVLARLPRDGGLDRSIFAAGLLALSAALPAAAELGPMAVRLGVRCEFPSLAAVAAAQPAPGEPRSDDLERAVALLRSPRLRSCPG